MHPVKIYGVIMCRNESTNITRSIDSLKGLDGLFVFDTGSTDNTIDIIRRDCKNNNLELFLLRGVFEDFSISRNKILDYARDECVKMTSPLGDVPLNHRWFILLDANDELRGSDILRSYLQNVNDEPHITRDVIYIKQQWRIGPENYLNFKNHRCIRADSTMRYVGVVHECVVESDKQNPRKRVDEISPSEICIYQDRLLDTTMSSEARWHRDKKLLQGEYDKDVKLKQKNPRTVFYLAQTYKCLGEVDSALKYYTERIGILEGFQEERYVAAWEVGLIYFNKHLASLTPIDKKEKPTHFEKRKKEYEDNKVQYFNLARRYFLDAYTLSPRAEPLLMLAKFHLQNKEWYQAYMYSHAAVTVPKPITVMLWYDEKVYDYERWHIHSQSAFYVNKFDEGRDACLKAIAYLGDSPIDKNNLLFYEGKCTEQRNAESMLTDVTFLRESIKELALQRTNLINTLKETTHQNYYDYYYLNKK